MRFYRPPFPAEYLYPGAVFRLKGARKTLCLTFDDGPDPASTPRLLEILEDLAVSAVFFCSGHKAEEYPDLVEIIRSKGHTVGNHGYYHIDGLKTACREYCENAIRADASTSAVLFRPPYGRMKPCQFRVLKKRYKIVLWDLMPYDFAAEAGSERCLSILRSRIRAGSVIVLHDRQDSLARSILEEFVISSRESGYSFENPFNKLYI